MITFTCIRGLILLFLKLVESVRKKVLKLLIWIQLPTIKVHTKGAATRLGMLQELSQGHAAGTTKSRVHTLENVEGT